MDKGIEPDIFVKRRKLSKSVIFEEAKKKKELFEKVEEEKKGEEEKDKLLEEDNQVQAAISVLKGIRVYKKLDEPEVAEVEDQSNS